MTELLFECLGWCLAMTVVASLLSAALYPVFARGIRQLSAASRALARLVYASSAPLVALLTAVLVTQPTVARLLIPAHCHGDQCGAHAPVYAPDSLMLLGAAFISSALLFLVLLMLLWALRRARRQFQLLRRLSGEGEADYRTLASRDLIACCVGLWQPKVLLSQGLIDALKPGELAVVLAHERAHAQRLDNLRALLLRWLTLFWPTPLRRRINQHARADAEQACDLSAALAVNDQEKVGAVIAKLSRLLVFVSSDQALRAAGFDCDHTRDRVAQLDNRCAKTAGAWPAVLLLLSLIWTVQIFVLAFTSHELIEWLGALGGSL